MEKNGSPRSSEKCFPRRNCKPKDHVSSQSLVRLQDFPPLSVCVARRVPGPSIRDCAGSFDNLAQMCPKLSAIDMTGKIFFERLYWVPGLGTLGPGFNCPYAPTPPPFNRHLFLDLCKKKSPNGPLFLWSARFAK